MMGVPLQCSAILVREKVKETHTHTIQHIYPFEHLLLWQDILFENDYDTH